MLKDERLKLKNRIRSMDHYQLDSYIDDIIEDLTIDQLKHVAWHIDVVLQERIDKYPNSFISAKEQEIFDTMHQGDNMEPSN